jgi:NAD-dependent SIR2 family protein deacetylase
MLKTLAADSSLVSMKGSTFSAFCNRCFYEVTENRIRKSNRPMQKTAFSNLKDFMTELITLSENLAA